MELRTTKQATTERDNNIDKKERDGEGVILRARVYVCRRCVCVQSIDV